MRGPTQKLLWIAFALWIGIAVAVTASSGRFAELLQFIPDTPETRREVYITDYFGAAEAIGLAPPFPYAGESKDLLSRLKEFAALPAGPYISGFVHWMPLEFNALLHEAVGYDLRNVSASIVAGDPSSLHSAIALDEKTDIEGIYSRVQVHANWPEPDQSSHRGVRCLSWGKDRWIDPARTLQPPVYDEFGRGARLAFFESVLGYAVWTEGILAMVDSFAGGRPSLAEVEPFRLLAEGLEALGVFGAYLSANTFSQSVEALMTSIVVDPETVARVQAESMLNPYCAYAVGIGREASEAFMGLVLVHQSEALCEENADRLRQRLQEGTNILNGGAWSDVFDPEKLAVVVDGLALRARVPIHPPSLWLQWALVGDPLLLHHDAGGCP